MAIVGCYTHITASGAQTLSPNSGAILNKIVVNAALTGTITVTDGSATVAVITNPTVGGVFHYEATLNTSLIVNPSATCDITVVWH